MTEKPSCYRVFAQSESVEEAKPDICIVGQRRPNLRIQIAVPSLNSQCHSRIVPDLEQQPAATDKDVFVPVKMMMVLGNPGRKIDALIVKVQLQFEMFHQIHLKADRREMHDIGTIIMKLGNMTAFRQPPLVVIAQHHSRMVHHVPDHMRSDRP